MAPPPDAAAPAPDAGRWRRLEELFRAAVDLPGAERRAYVAWSCGEDRELRRDLEELLAADAASEGFFARAVAAGLAATGGLEPAYEAVGLRGAGLRRVGPYRLLREIGRGGTGRVFLAERAEGGFGQRVAVKLLRPGMDSGEILARFATERSILARLEHPGIARLYDGGATADGQPYFVMEAVDGEPIDRWAAERRLDVPARLALFQKVCRAVHYAHQNLVVHRDLKPSNVLVTAGGEPKLLDFGIAKPLDPDLSHEATRTALRPMTPGYASPEQVRGAPVTTASDVYALGVLLYRLLAGRHPYRLEGSSPAELERRITEEDPPPPSTVAVRAADRRRLAGDLDNVVARAMEKRPERRYASAEQLASDLQRHLDGHPVVARRPTFAYRASRFFARHRWPALAVAALALLPASFVGSTLLQAERVEEERDRAERAAAVLVDLFEVADPGRGGSVTAREILDRGAVRVREEITGPPELRATVLETIARAYRNLGLYESAEPLLEETVALRRGALPGDDPRLASALDQLGVVRALRGDYGGAEPLLAEALSIHRTVFGPGHEQTSRSLNNLALVRHDRGDYEGAEPLYRRALELAATGGAEPHPSAVGNYALLLHDLGRYAEAESHFRRSIALRRASGAAGDAEVALDLAYLASTLQARGRLTEAEAVARRAVVGIEAVRAPDHPDLARALHVLGTVLVERGLTGSEGEAESLLRRALALRAEVLGARHPETAATREALARLHRARGELEPARRLYGEAIASYRESLPAGHASTAQAVLGLGELLAEAGEAGAARPLLLRAARELEAALGADHPDATRARERLRALRARPAR